MTNGDRTGVYRRVPRHRGGIEVKISRADVAEFMVQQLTDDTYLHKAPWVSY